MPACNPFKFSFARRLVSHMSAAKGVLRSGRRCSMSRRCNSCTAIGECEESSACAMLFFTWRTATGCVVVTTARACSTRFTSNPLHTASTVFSARQNHRAEDLCRPASCFRHAGNTPMTCGALCKTRQKHALYTSRSVLREHLRAGQEGASHSTNTRELSVARRERAAQLRARS